MAIIKYNNNTVNKLAMDSTINKIYYGGNLVYLGIQESQPTPTHTLLDYLYTDYSSMSAIQLLSEPNNTLYVEVDCQLISKVGSDAMIIGQKNEQETVSYQMGFMYYSSFPYYDYGGGRILSSYSTTQTDRHLYKIGRVSGTTDINTIGFIDGNTIQKTTVQTTYYQTGLPYLLNGRYNGSTPSDIYTANAASSIKYYSVKIYEDYGETLKGDYVPVRKANGDVTLYDTVTNSYCTTFGTIHGSDEDNI